MMKDTYLAGNEIIKSALAETNAEMNDNVVMNSVDTGQQHIMEYKKPSEDNYKRENLLLEKAIQFATIKHAGQLRKGTTTPYIVNA